MKSLIRRYLRYLGKERHYSSHTVTAYRNDLHQFSEFLDEHFQEPRYRLESIDNAVIRLFFGDLLDRGHHAFHRTAGVLASLSRRAKYGQDPFGTRSVAAGRSP